MYSHAHASHNPDNWAELPADTRSVVGNVLSDRFWQAGISEGSKDEFYARVMDKKNTLEGLASTIRGTVRFVRETCYAIIYCMSRLEMQFYGFSELPGPLAQALFQNSFHLSAHQQINLLNLVRYLVDDCPLEQREHFLPPLLAACFQQMDAKINAEWENLERQQAIQAAADALTEEMKSESILRQVTYTAVIMVADFLDPTKKSKYFLMRSGLVLDYAPGFLFLMSICQNLTFPSPRHKAPESSGLPCIGYPAPHCYDYLGVLGLAGVGMGGCGANGSQSWPRW